MVFQLSRKCGVVVFHLSRKYGRVVISRFQKMWECGISRPQKMYVGVWCPSCRKDGTQKRTALLFTLILKDVVYVVFSRTRQTNSLNYKNEYIHCAEECHIRPTMETMNYSTRDVSCAEKTTIMIRYFCATRAWASITCIV